MTTYAQQRDAFISRVFQSAFIAAFRAARVRRFYQSPRNVRADYDGKREGRLMRARYIGTGSVLFSEISQ